MSTKTRRKEPETYTLGTFEGSDGKRYEVEETVVHTEYQTTPGGQWNQAIGSGNRSHRTQCAEELKWRRDGSFVTLTGTVLIPIELGTQASSTT